MKHTDAVADDVHVHFAENLAAHRSFVQTPGSVKVVN